MQKGVPACHGEPIEPRRDGLTHRICKTMLSMMGLRALLRQAQDDSPRAL